MANKYMILIFGTGEGMADLSETEYEAHMGKWFKWDAELQEKGIKIHGEALNPEAQVISGKKMNVTSGLFVGKQMEHAVGGYYLINADSMEEAVEIAKGCPTFELDGNVEVREVMEMLKE